MVLLAAFHPEGAAIGARTGTIPTVKTSKA